MAEAPWFENGYLFTKEAYALLSRSVMVPDWCNSGDGKHCGLHPWILCKRTLMGQHLFSSNEKAESKVTECVPFSWPTDCLPGLPPIHRFFLCRVLEWVPSNSSYQHEMSAIVNTFFAFFFGIGIKMDPSSPVVAALFFQNLVIHMLTSTALIFFRIWIVHLNSIISNLAV